MARYIGRECVYDIIYKHRQGLLNMGAILMLDAIDKEVQKVPVADVQTVRHGRWENEYRDVDCWWAECTNCRNETHSKFFRVSFYAYCPECGARMDLKDGDTNE